MSQSHVSGQIDFNYNYDNNDVLPVRQTIDLAQS